MFRSSRLTHFKINVFVQRHEDFECFNMLIKLANVFFQVHDFLFCCIFMNFINLHFYFAFFISNLVFFVLCEYSSVLVNLNMFEFWFFCVSLNCLEFS